MVDDDRFRDLLRSAEGPRALHDDELTRIRSRLESNEVRLEHVDDEHVDASAQIDLLAHPTVSTSHAGRGRTLLAVAAASALLVAGLVVLATGRDSDQAGLTTDDRVAESTAPSSPSGEPCPDQPPAARSDPMNSTLDPRDVAASIAVASTLLLSCASDGDDNGSAAAQEPTTINGAETPVVSDPVDDGSETTVPPDDDGSESCASNCPLSEDERVIVDAFFEAYNGDDWEAWLDTLSTEEPTLRINPGYLQPTEQLREDFLWAAALNQEVTVDRCTEQFGTIRCEVSVEDDLFRGLADDGLEPGECVMTMSIVEGAIEPQSKVGAAHTVRGIVERRGCSQDYTILDKDFREWLAETHPESVPPETAEVDAASVEGAVSHLDEWLARVNDAMASNCQYGPLRDPTC